MITKQEKSKWLTDLTSNEFTQRREHLYCDGKHCCLGVLGTQFTTNDKIVFENSTEAYGLLDEKLSNGVVWGLVFMNDSDKKTFPEIVEWIRNNVKCEGDL